MREEFRSERLEETLNRFEKYYNDLRNSLRKNEESLNKEFLEIFDVQGEIDFRVNDRDLTIKKFDSKEFLKLFISYGVGCIFGRYSLKEEGIVNSKVEFSSLNINELESRFEEFLKEAFGEKYFRENLLFIAENLDMKDKEDVRTTIYRYFEKKLFDEHFKRYQKCPIYLKNGDEYKYIFSKI